MFMVDQAKPFREDDFAWIAELGFDFVRLPLDYRCWTDPTTGRSSGRTGSSGSTRRSSSAGSTRPRPAELPPGPGYTVASPPEPKSLWTDPEAQDVCALHWGTFARRFQGVPSREVSFNLFNEPANVEPEAHRKVVERMVEAIREQDRDRLIVCDGRD